MQTSNEQSRDGDGTTLCALPPPTKTPVSSTADEELGEVHEVQATQSCEGSPVSALPHKKSAKGMSMRRRIGLKIEADGATGSDGETQRKQSHGDADDDHVGDTSDQASGEEGWWKREYRRPPPGHLGAHAIAHDDAHSTLSLSPSQGPGSGAGQGTTARELEQVKSTAALPALAVIISRPAAERPHLFETPEQVKTRRGGSELYDSLTSHSSPNPKRKIMDLQDLEAGTFPSMGVAKELKRFHETNAGLQVEGESELARTLRTAVVTPSKLLHPMKKIDLQAGSGPHPLEKPTTGVSTKAPESA